MSWEPNSAFSLPISDSVRGGLLSLGLEQAGGYRRSPMRDGAWLGGPAKSSPPIPASARGYFTLPVSATATVALAGSLLVSVRVALDLFGFFFGLKLI